MQQPRTPSHHHRCSRPPHIQPRRGRKTPPPHRLADHSPNPAPPHPVHTRHPLPHKRSTRVGQPTHVPPACCGMPLETTTRCCGFGLDSPLPAYYSRGLTEHGAQQGAGPPEGPRRRPRNDHPWVPSSAEARRGIHRNHGSILRPHEARRQRPQRPHHQRKRQRPRDQEADGLRPADRGPEAHLEGPPDRAPIHPPRHPPV